MLEVGIGGRLDATNIVPRPVVCGITALGMDHMDMLGDTLAVRELVCVYVCVCVFAGLGWAVGELLEKMCRPHGLAGQQVGGAWAWVCALGCGCVCHL